MKKYRKIKFSLIELLVVMAITAVMLGIIIPTFHKVTKGVNVEMGARQIGAQLKAVREYAITHRKRVALIVPGGELTSSPPLPALSIPSNYLMHSYRPCIVNTSNVFDEWVFGERWEFMPDGTSILGVSNTIGGTTYNAATAITNVEFYDIASGIKSTANGIAFTPTGRCDGVRKFVLVGETTATGTNNVTITIDQFTGRISYGNE